jgi:hypothetical protein
MAPASPGSVLQADGVTIVPARRAPDMLRVLPPTLGPERVAGLPTEPGFGSRRHLTAGTKVAAHLICVVAWYA